MTKKQFPEGFFTKDRPIEKPRYIDADGLREYWLTNGKNERVYNTNDFLDSIDYQPTADVQPIVHAHWKIVKNLSGCCECSNCGMTVSADYHASPCVHYCAKCGAKMIAIDQCSDCPNAENGCWKDSGICYSCREDAWIYGKQIRVYEELKAKEQDSKHD